MLRLLSSLFLMAFIMLSCKNSQTIHKNNKNNSNLSADKLIQVDTNKNTLDSNLIKQWLAPDKFSTLVEMKTNLGTMKLELFSHTPIHTENFLKNIENQSYINTIFHRVIKGFMAQGGEPTTKNAKPGQRVGGGAGEQIEQEINSEYFHVKGALAAARMPDEYNPEKKSSAYQFYIVDGRPVTENQLDQIERKYNIVYGKKNRTLYTLLGGAAQLDMEYTVFGRIYEGLEVLDAIVKEQTDNFDRPMKDIKILEVKKIN